MTTFTEQQIETLAPDISSLKAGKGLSNAAGWLEKNVNERVLWGEIKGSGSKPYRTQIDLLSIAFKCSCPSFKFPCKHGIGLMLAFSKQQDAFTKTDSEPDWVKEWMDKRLQKVEKKADEPVGKTPEAEEKSEQAKIKRQNERLAQVEAGVAELELWLKDLVRTGFIQLPNKDHRFFEQTAARMVDAKATGLAGRVRALRDLNYIQNNDWQAQALQIVAEIYLLIEAFKNSEKLSPNWQQTLKNLIGWSQSPKELLQNADAEKVKDIWVVLGQLQEESEGITIQRNWLWGSETGKTALILNFGTPFSPLENTVLPGSTIEAELVFFPSVQPHRAVLSLQKGFQESLTEKPDLNKNWVEVYEKKGILLTENPFMNDPVFLVENMSLVLENQKPILCDSEGYFQTTSPLWNENKMLTLFAVAGNSPQNMAGVFRRDGFLPLGIFEGNKYVML